MAAIQEIDVILNLDEISLRIKNSRLQLQTGHPVVWRFKAERKTGSGPVAFPRGWVPLVLFEAEGPEASPKNLNYGPFDGLTQVLNAAKGEETLSVESKGVAVKAGVFGYYAGLVRGTVEGQEPGEHREFRLLSTARREIEVTGEPVGNVDTPVEPDLEPVEPDLEFAVYRDTDSLRIEEVKAPKKNSSGDPIINANSTVVWRFSDLGEEVGLYPSVLFYQYRQKPEGQAAAGDVNVSFGPFSRLTFESGKVTGQGVSATEGYYHYEAVLLTNRLLRIDLASTGDPILDNEGIQGIED